MPSFQDMSPRAQVLLFAVLAVVLFFLGQYALLSGARADNAATETQIQSIDRQNAQLRPYARQAELLRAENQTLQRQLDTLLSIVPTQQATDQFVRDLQDTAERSAVFIRKISVKSLVRKEFYVAAPYDLTLDGSYADLQRFYANLGRLQRIVNVDALALKGIGRNEGNYPYTPGESVSADCTVTTFFSADTTAAAASPARGKQAK